MQHGCVLFALALGLACGNKSEEADKAPPPTTKAEPPRADEPKPERAKSPTQPAPKPISKRDARARLDEWLEAQNKGDFALYETQYASTLTGIKRVRDRKTEYDRNGWLADRKRMFRNQMVVEAADVKINVDGKPVTVELVQTWRSGSFKDVGAKRLTLVREEDKVLIAREEMLSSKVVPSHPATADIEAIHKRIGDTEGEEIEVGVPGMSGMARRYEVDGEVVKIWDNISADHHDDSITIYLKDGKPFYASWDVTTGEDVEWDESGGTAGKSRYIFREFLLSDTAVIDAWERDKTFDGEYPSGADDELMATKPTKLTLAIGNPAYFDAITSLANHLRTATTDDYNKYEAVRGAFSELDE